MLEDRLKKLELDIKELKDPFSSLAEERDFSTVRQVAIKEILRLQKMNEVEGVTNQEIRDNVYVMVELITIFLETGTFVRR